MITLRTNLDEDYIIIPPYSSLILPPLGSFIICGIRGSNRKAKLEVYSLIYEDEGWVVELGIPKQPSMSLKDWYKFHGVTSH